MRSQNTTTASAGFGTGSCRMRWNGYTWDLVEDNCVYPYIPPNPQNLPPGSYVGEEGYFACDPASDAARMTSPTTQQVDQAASYYIPGQEVPATEYGSVSRFNLLYHVYPNRTHDAWIDNIQQLKRRLPLFNGRKIVAVATGSGLAGIREVQAVFDAPDVEYIAVDNDAGVGQTASFFQLLNAVHSKRADEATFYAHTKGAAKGDRDAAAIRHWRNAMYERLLDDPGMVIQALRHFPVVGALKKVHRGGAIFPSSLCWSRWHFSGTFFWFRHDRIFNDFRWPFIPHDYYGVETWLGGFVDPEEAWSLLQPFRETDSTWDGYNLSTWVGTNGSSRTVSSTTSHRSDGACRVSVVIPCKGRLEHLRQTLPYWFQQDVAPHEIIVVDYGCPDHCGDWVRENYPGVRVVQATRDVEFYNGSRARNVGACAASGNYIAFADADFVAPPDYLARVRDQIHLGHSLVGIAFYDSGQRGMNGTCVVSSELFHRVRGYDESSSTYGYDDTEFYGRCRQTGTSFGYLHNCQCLNHSDEQRMQFYPEHDKSEAMQKAAVWMADRPQQVNLAGYGQL